MDQQVMEAALSFRTNTDGADAEIGIFRASPTHLRLYVQAPDGSGRVDFVHLGVNWDRSVTFLRDLAEQANRLADELAATPLLAAASGADVRVGS
ncbi:MAG TPA: hypothetical protein VF444_11355 [Pseudonocardiaceae bacterium]